MCGVIALAGAGDGPAVWFAWGYVALRIAHSIVQATVNRVQPRFVFFSLSSACLVALTVCAALAIF